MTEFDFDIPQICKELKKSEEEWCEQENEKAKNKRSQK